MRRPSAPVPSAGARHAFETYLYCRRVETLEEGIYRYLPLEHRLLFEFTEPGLAARISEACFGQRFVGQGAVTFFWSVIPYRMEWRYGPPHTASSRWMSATSARTCTFPPRRSGRGCARLLRTIKRPSMPFCTSMGRRSSSFNLARSANTLYPRKRKMRNFVPLNVAETSTVFTPNSFLPNGYLSGRKFIGGRGEQLRLTGKDPRGGGFSMRIGRMVSVGMVAVSFSWRWAEERSPWTTR